MGEILIHPTAEVSGAAVIGAGTKIWNQAQVREGAQIGKRCIIGKNVYIDENVSIGSGVKIQNNVNVYHGVTIEDDVFLGPSMTFMNDMFPRAFSTDWKIVRTVVRRGASIGANVAIRCGVEIGEYAVVGAGSTVTKDVPAYALVAGNPARQIGWVCKCGFRLDENSICPGCGKRYRFDELNNQGFSDDLGRGMTMRKIPVTKPYFTDEEETMAIQVLRSGWVAQGPKVAEFEKRIAAHEGVAEGVATTSCTTALHLAMAVHGIASGMDVIAPAFTFVATVNAIVETGATPVLADVHEETFNIDVEGLRHIIEERYRRRDGRLVDTKTGNTLWGIVPVHEFGLCCDMEKINALAQEYCLCVIEDAACALGARIGDRHQGAFGNTSCVSFHPRKSITTGEGGMVLTDDAELAERMRELRSHGSSISADVRDKQKGFLLPEYDEAGFNYRMTDIQGAIGLAQVKKLDSILEKRRELARNYDELISLELKEFIVPTEPNGYFHTYQSYVCMLDLRQLNLSGIEEGGNYRNRLLEQLEDIGIATRQGTHAIHLLGYYKNRFNYRPEDYIHAYACDRLSITLPLYFGMTKNDQEYVIDCIRKIVREM